MIDAVALTVEELSKRLFNVQVSTEIRDPRPDNKYVMVTLDGLEIKDFLQTATVTLVAWGESDAEANGLALDCVEAMSSAALEHAYLSASKLSAMQRTSWGDDGITRYTVSLLLTINPQ